MNLTERLLPVALLGAEWVLWLLVALSVVSVTIMIERVWYYRATFLDIDSLLADLKLVLVKPDVDKALDAANAATKGYKNFIVGVTIVIPCT